MKQQPLVSIIIPTYKESKNLSLLIPMISLNLKNHSHEIIIVDDNSQDGTDKVVEQLKQDSHKVTLIIRQKDRGLSSAVLHGFQQAHGKYLVCMDADLQHPPEKLPEFIYALGSHDFVIGTR